MTIDELIDLAKRHFPKEYNRYKRLLEKAERIDKMYTPPPVPTPEPTAHTYTPYGRPISSDERPNNWVTPYTFTLSKSQQEKLSEWENKIKDLHGEFGTFQFKFTPTGIGTAVEVYSKLAGVTIDLTEYETW